MWEAVTGKLSYPKSEVRGRSWEDSWPEGRRPRGVTPRPRSGAAAESARLLGHRNGQEELPKSDVRGGCREKIPHVQGQNGGPEELPHTPMPEARGGGQEDQTHIQGAVAAWA